MPTESRWLVDPSKPFRRLGVISMNRVQCTTRCQVGERQPVSRRRATFPLGGFLLTVPTLDKTQSVKTKPETKAEFLKDPDVVKALEKIAKELIEGLKSERAEAVYVLTRRSMPGLVRIGRIADDARHAPELSDSECDPPFVLAGFARVADSHAVERTLLDALGGARTVEDRQVVRVEVEEALRALWKASGGPIEVPGVDDSVRRKLQNDGAFLTGGEINVSVSGDEAVFSLKLGGRSARTGVRGERLESVPLGELGHPVEPTSTDGPSADEWKAEPVPHSPASRWRLIDTSARRNRLGFGRLLLWLFFLWAFWSAAEDTGEAVAIVVAVGTTLLFVLRLLSSSGVRFLPPWEWRS